MGKRNNVIGIIAVVVAAISILSLFYDDIQFNNLPIEEKLLYGKNFDDEKQEKNMLCWFEVEDGFVHVERINNKNSVSIYHTSEDFSTVVAICDFTEENINRDNYTVPLDTQLFASGLYINCYKHKEGLKIFANGNELEVHTFTFECESGIYEIDLWYIRADELPEITTDVK